jgi:triphosphoribosyl-dephospho-CoA synthase
VLAKCLHWSRGVSAAPRIASANSSAGTDVAHTDRIAKCAERSLLAELGTWPKPGLVSDIDNGSHTDMDATLFRRSAAAIRPYFRDLAAAGAEDAEMSTLRAIGIRAEHAMLMATRGVNTHRGAIFGLGLLCAAAGLRAVRSAQRHENANLTLGRLVAWRWGRDIVNGPRLADSHGELAARRYGAGGARREAAHGFPSVYRVGLPALTATLQLKSALQPASAEAPARVQACFALIAVLEDTNLLHRGGNDGLNFARRAAQRFLDDGGVCQPHWRARAAAVHRAFVARRLSPGGAADALAMSLFVAALEPGGER